MVKCEVWLQAAGKDAARSGDDDRLGDAASLMALVVRRGWFAGAVVGLRVADNAGVKRREGSFSGVISSFPQISFGKARASVNFFVRILNIQRHSPECWPYATATQIKQTIAFERKPWRI